MHMSVLQQCRSAQVYTRSSLAEQTTPAARGFNAVTSVQSGDEAANEDAACLAPSVQDTFSPVSQLQFVDKANASEPYSRAVDVLSWS